MLWTIPNLVVCAPGDPIEAKAVTTFAASYNGPCYIRIGKAGEPLVHEEDTVLKLYLGEILRIRNNGDTAVFSTGAMLKYVIDFVEQNNIIASVFSFPFIKPVDKKTLVDLLIHTKK